MNNLFRNIIVGLVKESIETKITSHEPHTRGEWKHYDHCYDQPAITYPLGSAFKIKVVNKLYSGLNFAYRFDWEGRRLEDLLTIQLKERMLHDQSF